ncbi:MAG: NmrA/HSCARG family protein [Thermodesulfobacteriota bacterium]
MTIQGTKKVLVAGICEHLGGAFVPKLQSEGHGVRVLTDHPDKHKGLATTGVEVAQGSACSAQDLLKALDGCNAACLMGVPHEEEPAREAECGKATIDACRTKGIAHFVYVSVCCADKKTGVPHFDAKCEAEEYLKRSGLSYTILRPTWYMENFVSKRFLPSIEKGVLCTPLRPERTLELISAADVGRVVAEACTVPDKFNGREIDLAADRLTMEEIAQEISRVMPGKVAYDQMSESDAARDMSPHMVSMFQWLDRHGYTADINQARELLHRYGIALTSFRDFLDRCKGEIRKAA